MVGIVGKDADLYVSINYNGRKYIAERDYFNKREQLKSEKEKNEKLLVLLDRIRHISIRYNVQEIVDLIEGS